jgi:exodeoxyribonuclease V beta subunit
MQIFDLYSENLDGTKLIEASAGTGKTFTLSGLYIRYIVEKKLMPDQILVLTFTTAATAELKTRLREQLIQCRNHLLGSELVDSKEKQLYALYESYRGQETALKQVEFALLCFDQAAIFTINSFCQKIIDDFNSDCGSPVFDELIVIKDYVKKFVYEFWRKQQKTTAVEFLATVPAIDKVIKKFIAMLNKNHYQHIKPQLDWNDLQDLYQDFGDLAIQWREQKEALLDYVLSGDFNGNSYSFKKREKYRQEMDIFFTNFSGSVIKFCADFIESKLKKNISLKPMPIFFNKFETFYNKVFYSYGSGSSGNNIAISYLFECFQYVQKQLTDIRVEQGKFNYSDQIQVVHDGVCNNPNLVNSIANQWQCIMVDEFQDTDGLQLEIFEKCFNNGKHDLIYVGDPKQAIYDFRGADVFVYNKAKEHTKTQFNLATNWRSSDKMLAASNAMFNYENSFKFPWLSFAPSLAKSDQEFQLDDIYPPVAIIDSEIENRKTVLVNEIKRFLLSANVNCEQIKPESCAILVKANKDAIELYEHLLSCNLDVSLWSESGVFTTLVAKQIYYLIRALNYPSQDNIFTTLHGLFFEKSLNQLQQLNMENVLVEFIDYRLEINRLNIVTVIEKIFENKDVYSRILKRIDGERHFTDLQQIIELMQEQVDQGSNANQMEQWLATQIQQAEFMENDDQRKRRIESDNKKISIMTIHKSKGLEFDHIFIPYADKINNKLPSENINLRACLATHDDNNGLLYWRHSNTAFNGYTREKQAENVRNLYVAITRARHRVYLGVDKKAKTYDQLPIAQLLKQIEGNDDLCSTVIPCQPIIQNDKVQAVKLTKPKDFQRSINKPLSIYSFSGLSKKQGIIHQEIDEPEVELINESLDEKDAEIDYSDYFQFPKGSKSGTMQHEVLENLDFNANTETIYQEVQQQLKSYQFDEKWQDCLRLQIEKILNTRLWQKGPKLSELNHTVDEMEFMLPVGSITNKTIGDWLSTHRKTTTLFNQEHLQGYLTGFIDLIFEFKNKFYIIDYKSNYLGKSIDYYTSDNIKDAIEHHYYDLQYLLYSVALVKYLSLKIDDFSYADHFGGIAYIFTRGVNGEVGQGIYATLPDEKLIESMSGEFNAN